MEAAEPTSITPEETPTAVFKKRGARSKGNPRKRPPTPPPASSGSGSESSSEDDTGRPVKRRKKTAAVGASSIQVAEARRKELSATVLSADRDAPINIASDATKQSNLYDDGGEDALSANNLLGSTRALAKEEALDGTYKNVTNQTTFIKKNPNARPMTVGPIKAPSNLRTVTVLDFAPDVCKDYRLTGWCGFGDNCKFLHSREDYKQGWQLEKEWEDVSKSKRGVGGTVVASANRDRTSNGYGDDDEEAMLENIPFVCIICRESYKDPVATRCGHYFCESCALKRYRRDPTCAACSAGTNGVFNTAKRLKKLLERKRERVARRRQEAIEAGEEVSDEDGEAEAETAIA